MQYLKLTTQHDVDIIINSDQIVFAQPQFAGSPNTLLFMTNGKQFSVTRPIEVIYDMLAARDI